MTDHVMNVVCATFVAVLLACIAVLAIWFTWWVVFDCHGDNKPRNCTEYTHVTRDGYAIRDFDPMCDYDY